MVKAFLKTPTYSMMVAIKTLKDSGFLKAKKLHSEFLKEFMSLKELSHPNIIKLYGVCTSGIGAPFLVMEYAERKSLR